MEENLAENLTARVLAKLDTAPDPRFREVMRSLVQHLHGFIRETQLTEAEWIQGIGFLTATGQKCDGRRQEFILLSDTLGVSMLVDAINNSAGDGATETTVLGPFYSAQSRDLPTWANIAEGAPGEPTFVQGTVRALDGAPIAGAVLDLWQTDGEGLYDQQRGGEAFARGRITADAQGQFGFRTVRPVSYPVPTDGPVGAMLKGMGRHPYRPAHIHAIVSAPGYRALTTHLFVKGDPYLDSDAVFGVKDSLVVDFEASPPGPTPDGGSSGQGFFRVRYDFRLAPA